MEVCSLENKATSERVLTTLCFIPVSVLISGVAVITSALHAVGHEFDPRAEYFLELFLLPYFLTDSVRRHRPCCGRSERY